MKNSAQAFNGGSACNSETDSRVQEQEQHQDLQPQHCDLSAAPVPNFTYVYQQNYSNIPVQFISQQPQPIYYASNYPTNVSYMTDINPVYCDSPNNIQPPFISDQTDPTYMASMNFRYQQYPNKGHFQNNYLHKDNRDGSFHNIKSQWSGDIHHHKNKPNSLSSNYNRRDKGSPHFHAKSSPLETNDQSNSGRDEPVELLITNLDYNIPPKEWKKIISTQLQNALNINQTVLIQTRLDGSLCATVKINSLSEARLAISHFHRKKIGYKRIHVNIINSNNTSQSFQGLKQEVVALLQSVYNNSLSVSKFIELFARRFHRTITISDLYKLRDIVEIKDDSNSGQNGGGRVIQLLNTNNDSHIEKESLAKVSTIEPSFCRQHCSESLAEHLQSAESCILPNVIINLNSLKQQVHHLLMTHDGSLPLLSFVKCYEAEFGELSIVKMNKAEILENSACSDINSEHNCPGSQCSMCSSGNTSGLECADCTDPNNKQEGSGNSVPLEHLLTCIPGVQIVTILCGTKKLAWEINGDKNGTCSGDTSQWSNNVSSHSTKLSNDILSDRLHQFSREVVELLKHQPNCRLLLSKFIPTYHHYFGKQCRVADYGYAKLNELMESINHVVHVMGSGTVRHLTLSHKVQVRRFTNELVKVLKSQTTKSCKLSEFSSVFEKILKREFRITEYGVCFIEDMLKEIPDNTVELVTALVPDSYQSDNVDGSTVCSNETFLCIPKRIQTAEEKERTQYFSQEVFQLLKQSPRMRLPFNKFIPSYHHHFSKQCKVSDYGFSKLFELLEAISQTTKIFEENEEKYVTLTRRECLRVIAEQILTLLETSPKKCMTLKELSDLFLIQHGYSICPEDYGVKHLHELITKIPRIARLQVNKSILDSEAMSQNVASSEDTSCLSSELLSELSENDISVCLNDRNEIKNMAHKLLLLLLEIPEGILPGVQFFEKYRNMFREDPDINTIESQLFEIIFIIRDSMDYNNFWIRLKPLVMLSRDLRDVLRIYQGKILLTHLESAYVWLFGVDLRPQLYGFGNLNSMIQAVPFVANLVGRGLRTTVCLSNDFIGKLSYKTAYSFEPIMDTDDIEAEAKEQENSGSISYCIPGNNEAPVFTIVNYIGQNGASQCHLPVPQAMNSDMNQERVNPAYTTQSAPMTYSMTYACNRNAPYYCNPSNPEQKHLDQLVEQLAFDRTSPNSIHFQNGGLSNGNMCAMPSPNASFPAAQFPNSQPTPFSNPIQIPNACFPSDALAGSTLWQPNFASYCGPPQGAPQFFAFDPQYNTIIPAQQLGQEEMPSNCEYKVVSCSNPNYQFNQSDNFCQNEICDTDNNKTNVNETKDNFNSSGNETTDSSQSCEERDSLEESHSGSITKENSGACDPSDCHKSYDENNFRFEESMQRNEKNAQGF